MKTGTMTDQTSGEQPQDFIPVRDANGESAYNIDMNSLPQEVFETLVRTGSVLIGETMVTVGALKREMLVYGLNLEATNPKSIEARDMCNFINNAELLPEFLNYYKAYEKYRGYYPPLANFSNTPVDNIRGQIDDHYKINGSFTPEFILRTAKAVIEIIEKGIPSGITLSEDYDFITNPETLNKVFSMLMHASLLARNDRDLISQSYQQTLDSLYELRLRVIAKGANPKES